MPEFISNLQTSYETYASIGKVLLLLVSILGLLLLKSNQRIRVIIIYITMASLIILNPFLINKEIEVIGEKYLYRMGMLLLVPILSAYSITVLYKKNVEKKQKIIAMIGIIVLIAASGKFVYTNSNFYKADNSGKVYDLAIELAECVTQTNETPTVAISEVQGVFIRQYNANIKLICAPVVTENWVEAEDENTLLMRAMLADSNPDMKELTNLAKELRCDYLVLLKYQIQEDSPVNYGFNFVNTFEKFSIFENKLGAE